MKYKYMYLVSTNTAEMPPVKDGVYVAIEVPTNPTKEVRKMYAERMVEAIMLKIREAQ